jgi:hypothetical protein
VLYRDPGNISTTGLNALFSQLCTLHVEASARRSLAERNRQGFGPYQFTQHSLPF